MRYTRIKIISIILTLSFLLTACGKASFSIPYGTFGDNAAYTADPVEARGSLPLFASGLAAVSVNITDTAPMIDTGDFTAAALYCIDDREVLYSYDACKRIEPASLTKLMTALLVAENCSRLDDIITVGDVSIKEEGVQRFGLKEGDRISIRSLLQIMFVHSGNDAALCLSEYVGGIRAKENDRGKAPADIFTELMNERAKALGCSGTHFTNAHGLSDSEHYSTVYDLYIILDKLLEYEDITDIMSLAKVTVKYSNAAGEVVEKTVTNTDLFLSGGYLLPEGFSIIAGKTGSTAAAGRCLIIGAKYTDGKKYIAAVTGAADHEKLYGTMSELLKICDR